MRALWFYSRRISTLKNQLVRQFRHHTYCSGTLTLESKKKTPCAVLVDAESTPSRNLNFVLAQLSDGGCNPHLRKAFGDWSNTNMVPYQNIEKNLSFSKIDSPALVRGKGTSDAALIVGAMDILHKHPKKIECFALVTSDPEADFTPLVTRLKQAGKATIGFGTQQTPKAVADSYDEFVYLLGNQKSQKQAPQLREKKQFLWLTILKKSNARGWVSLDELDKDFDHRKYGYETKTHYFDANADRFQLDLSRDSVRIHLSTDGLHEIGDLIVRCHDKDRWAPVKDLEDSFNARLYGYDGIENLLDDFPELFVKRKESNKGQLVRNKVPEKFIQELKTAIESSIFEHTIVEFIAPQFHVDAKRFGYLKLEDLLDEHSEHFVLDKDSEAEGNYLVKIRKE